MNFQKSDRFFLSMIPPTVTSQEKGIDFKKKKVYTKQSVRDAENKFDAHLTKHIPPEPLNGPVGLAVDWCFPITGKHKDGEWKTSKPDTDNLIKMLKDRMTHLKFWNDDAQIVIERSSKRYSDTPGVLIGYYEIIDLEMLL